MKNIIKKIVPKSIKNKLLVHYTDIVKKLHASHSEKVEQRIHESQLESKHIQNLKALTTREELLKVLPKNGVVAEIGVDQGVFTEAILKLCQPKKLHLIDVWGTERYHQGKKELVERKFDKEIKNKIVELNLGFSTEVVNEFDNDYFDWIYIDTDHSYKNTLEELQAYSKKVKLGGIIAGHDFIIGNWKGLVKYGVIDAVYEFCKNEDWELIYLTMEHKGHPSFAIRRINT